MRPTWTSYYDLVQSLRVRRAEARESDALTALVLASDAYGGTYASGLVGYQVTAEYIERHRVFVAVDAVDGDLLGVYGLVLDPPELDLLFVANGVQRRGVGRTLVEHMITQARGAGVQTVRVVSHPDAESFYRRMGARRVGTVPPRPPRVTWERPELRFSI